LRELLLDHSRPDRHCYIPFVIYQRLFVESVSALAADCEGNKPSIN